jgi:dTDP-4-dehydrorhamnose reductase
MINHSSSLGNLAGEASLDEPVELWGGVECTRNRVGDRYFDQIESTGHGSRPFDLDLFASLGLRKLRYPLLWESIAPHGLASADWRRPDERLARMRALGVHPIVGFVHHGSGPPHTSLMDPRFPEQLAAFAGAVAARYPWLRHFTPVNEPVTTARFSGLYGHWYPHSKDDASFARMVVHQCRAVALAMRAVRERVPEARLIHIDDGGHTYGTSVLQDQVDFENHRRWLGFDLLDARVVRGHPLYDYLVASGIAESELDEFARQPCRPDVVGLNYYATSDRFLDHRVELYPPSTWGGNGRIRYADVEAVRVRREGLYGQRSLLLEAWTRYRLPLALTEVHLGCTREEQLRWLMDAWNGAVTARRLGADVRAVTAWALLGSMDWDSLVTRDAKHYEPGAFDVRAPAPRCTAIGAAIKEIAAGRHYSHPVVATPGWWQRPTRLLWGGSVHAEGAHRASREHAAPLLVCGAKGTLGNAFARACFERGLSYRLLRRADMDIARPASVKATLERFQPWAVINAAGYVRVDDADSDLERCLRDNTVGPATLAACCRDQAVALLTFSSDLVFDGQKRSPYLETDATGPLSVYGRSKREAELRVLANMPSALVVRTSAFFGPWDEHNFVTLALAAMQAGRRFDAAADCFVSPTYVPDLVATALDLLIDGESGIWHLANRGGLTWAELARKAALMAGLADDLVRSRPLTELSFRAQRPTYSVLGSERADIMPHLDDALARYFQARNAFLSDSIPGGCSRVSSESG